jgi:hypothetical protein
MPIDLRFVYELADNVLQKPGSLFAFKTGKKSVPICSAGHFMNIQNDTSHYK